MADVEGSAQIEGVAALIHKSYMDCHSNKVVEDAVFRSLGTNHPLSRSLSCPLSLSLSVSLSVLSLSVSTSLGQTLSVSLSLAFCRFLSFSLTLSLSLSLSDSLYHSLCVSLSHTSLTCSLALPLYPSSVFLCLCLALAYARAFDLSFFSRFLILSFSRSRALPAREKPGKRHRFLPGLLSASLALSVTLFLSLSHTFFVWNIAVTLAVT